MLISLALSHPTIMSLYAVYSDLNTGYQIDPDSSDTIVHYQSSDNDNLQDTHQPALCSTTVTHNFPTSCYAYYYADPGAYDSTSTEAYQSCLNGIEAESNNAHAQAATLSTQNPFLQNNLRLTVVDSPPCHSASHADDTTPTSQWCVQASAVLSSSSHQASDLPQNGMDLSPFTFSTPSEQSVDHANNPPRTVHEYSGDSTTIKKRSNEIRQRRADRRKAKVLDISSALTFRATDPDLITSHEKKRLYVGGLEEYVVWMEEQVRLLGKQPKPMQKLPDYKGISSRSLRTMLAHFQNEAEKLHTLLKNKEQNFLELESRLRCQEASDNTSSLSSDGTTSDFGWF